MTQERKKKKHTPEQDQNNVDHKENTTKKQKATHTKTHGEGERNTPKSGK